MEIRQVENNVNGFMSQVMKDANEQGQTFSDCISVQHKPGASCYKPVNGNPFVVLFKGEEIKKVTFKPDNVESGTDLLRARILAEKLFQEIQ